MTLVNGAQGGGEVIPPQPSGSGITQLTGDVTAGPGIGSVAATLVAIQGVTIDLTALTSGDVLEFNGTDWVNTPGGGGGIDSITGAGVTNPTGNLNQSGGMTITDTEGDTFSVITNKAFLSIVGGPDEGNVAIDGYIAPVSISIGGGNFGPTGLPSNFRVAPVTVAAGVNDTFVYTPIATGTPETFTVAPGVYATLDQIVTAVNAATGSASGEAFNSLYGFVTDEFGLYFQGGTIADGDTITTGPTDVLADLGFNSPVTISSSTDLLVFFNPRFEGGGVPQQTITGALSAVLDANVKAILTSFLTALSATAGYGLVIDGTT